MGKKILISSFLASAMFLVAAIPAYASAPLSGWAWSSNIGWISFNSADTGAGGGPYGVQVSTSTVGSDVVGTMSGYAWSPNIGWISFNSGGCPSGTCTPTVDVTTGAVSGWIKATSADNNGWDGWIELAGANHPTQTGLTGSNISSQGVSFNFSSGQFSGYAWGSDVVGWMNWNNVIANGLCPSSGCVNQPTQNTLAVNVVGNGTVGSNDTINNCTASGGANCTETVANPTSVTLTAGLGTFLGWSNSVGFTPACSGIGTCVVSINGSDSVTATFTTNNGNPTVSSCNLNLPSGPYNAPYTLSLSGATVTASGGTGPYTYLWSDDTTSFNQVTQFANLPGGTYPISVEAVDKTGATSAQYTCGSIAVTAVNNPAKPELWPGSPAKQSSYNFSGNPTFSTHTHPGHNVTVSYAWPNSPINTCVPSGTTGLTPNWNTVNLGTTGAGSLTFTNVLLGIYTLGYTCTDNTDPQNPVITHSNSVEIDATPSTYGEK